MHEWMIEWTKNWINEINEMKVVKNIEEKTNWSRGFTSLNCEISIKLLFFGVTFDRDLKVIILGDTSVGKTSLIQRYLNGVFTGDTISVSVL